MLSLNCNDVNDLERKRVKNFNSMESAVAAKKNNEYEDESLLVAHCGTRDCQ